MNRSTSYYPTVEKASRAAKKLNIKDMRDYALFHKRDRRLPNRPEDEYKDQWEAFGGWHAFLGLSQIEKPLYYSTLNQSRKAALSLGILSAKEYKKRHKEDPRLPPNPGKFYPNAWTATGGWVGFFDYLEKYTTIEEASNAAKKLGIKSFSQYKSDYLKDRRLVSKPNQKYHKDWKTFGSWKGFLGIEKTPLYETYEEASRAACSLGIKDTKEYRIRYKEDERLSASPHNLYRSEWKKRGGMRGFLNQDSKRINSNFYQTLEEAGVAARRLNVATILLYKNKVKNIKKLPANPDIVYREHWQAYGGWSRYLGCPIAQHAKSKKSQRFYPTIEEASAAAIALEITTGVEYAKQYKKDSRLPSNPHQYYREHWRQIGGFKGFLGKG